MFFHFAIETERLLQTVNRCAIDPGGAGVPPVLVVLIFRYQNREVMRAARERRAVQFVLIFRYQNRGVMRAARGAARTIFPEFAQIKP